MFSVRCGSLFAAHRKFPSVLYVPFLASRTELLSVSFEENRRSELILQRRKSARSRH